MHRKVILSVVEKRGVKNGLEEGWF